MRQKQDRIKKINRTDKAFRSMEYMLGTENQLIVPVDKSMVKEACYY